MAAFPGCLMLWLFSPCLYLPFSIFKHINIQTRGTHLTHASCGHISHWAPAMPSLSAARLSNQLLRLKREKKARWNTSACFCCRWSMCGSMTSLWRTLSPARETSSHCKTLWEPLVKNVFSREPNVFWWDTQIDRQTRMKINTPALSALMSCPNQSIHPWADSASEPNNPAGPLHTAFTHSYTHSAASFAAGLQS